jgi:hypothetical protein
VEHTYEDHETIEQRLSEVEKKVAAAAESGQAWAREPEPEKEPESLAEMLGEDGQDSSD